MWVFLSNKNHTDRANVRYAALYLGTGCGRLGEVANDCFVAFHFAESRFGGTAAL